MNQSVYIIYITVNPISYCILITKISIIIFKLWYTILHFADLAIILTIELSLFKQNQINLAHLISKLINPTIKLLDTAVNISLSNLPVIDTPNKSVLSTYSVVI